MLNLSLQPVNDLQPTYPRVHENGREYYERSNKSSDWFTHSARAVNSKPEARLRTDSARDIAVKNRGCVQDSLQGCADPPILEDIHPRSIKPEGQDIARKSRGHMQENLQGYADPPITRNIHPRGIRPDAYKIAEENKGKWVKSLLGNYGQLDISPRPGPKVKGSEAEEYREREHGSTKVLLNHFSTDPIPISEQPPAQRLGLGAEEIAEKHKGERMGPILRLEGEQTPRDRKIGRLHQESTGSGWDEDPPHHRIRPEAMKIAQKNSSDSVNEIILQNPFTPPKRKEPKILKHLTESAAPRNMPPLRVRLDGVDIFERATSQTEMSAIMHGFPKVFRPTSGQKILPHLQKSELW